MVAEAAALCFWLNLCPVLAALQRPTAEVERYSQEAEDALAKKDLRRAAAALERLSQLTPKVPEVQANLGMVYYTQGRLEDAVKAFQRALKLSPDIPNAQLMLGVCFAELGRSEEAEPILSPAFKSPPDSSMGRLIGLELQRIYAALGQYDKAEAVSNELLRRYPKDPEILYHASRLRGDRALRLMIELVDTAPNSLWVHLASAQVLESEKHYDSAVTQYRMALKMDPRLPGVHFSLGRDLLLSSSIEKAAEGARQEFEQELAINPHNANAEYELGEICRRRGQFEDGREHFLRAVELNPGFEDAQIALARILIDLKKPREALPHLLAAVRANPANEVSHFLLAAVYQSVGDTVDQAREMALYQKYHAQPYPAGLASDARLPEDLTGLSITKQTLSSTGTHEP